MPEILPDEPSADIYNQILDNLSILSQDVKNLSLFLGVFVSVEALKDAYPSAVLHSYAYIAGGNIWTYEESGWTDSGKPSPNEVPPLSDSIPLMDGEGSAGTSVEVSRADHVHPDNKVIVDRTIKCLYNGGAFDTEVSNGDGTKTITRQTGYVTLNGSENWLFPTAGSNAIARYARLDIEGIWQAPATAANTPGAALRGDGVTNRFPWTQILNFDDIPAYTVCFNAAGKQFNVFIPLTKTLAEFKADLAATPLIIQYQTITSYTEQVIENQPIHTLNQAGEQWLRSEWRKGLNLIDGSTIKQDTVVNNRLYLPNIPIEEGYYSFSVENLPSGIQFALCVSSTQQIGYPDTDLFQGSWLSNFPEIRYLPKGYLGLRIRKSDDSAISNSNLNGVNLMLNEGNHAYPYEEYYGEIVRVNEVPIYFSTVNTSPASTIGGDWTSLGSFTIGSTIVYAWRRV